MGKDTAQVVLHPCHFSQSNSHQACKTLQDYILFCIEAISNMNQPQVADEHLRHF